MRRRVALVLLSLLSVLVLASAGWLIDSVASRPQAQSPTLAPVRANPTTPGPTLFREIAAAMIAGGAATYTFSGSIGGGEIQSGIGALRFLPGAAPGRSFDADVTVTSPTTGRTRAVLLPSSLYLALPPAPGLPRNKPWLKVSSAPRTELGRRLLPLAAQMRAAFEPAQTLGLLGAAAHVEEIGPGTVEGVAVTTHRATVGLRQAAVVVQDEGVREQYRAMIAAGFESLQIEVCLDARGRPRRFHAEVPSTAGLYSVTGIYRAWGQRVKIKAPAAGRVFDADKIKG